MKKIISESGLIIVLIAMIIGLFFLWRKDHREMVREKQNVGTLTSEVEFFKLKDSSNAAQSGILNLSIQELKDATDKNLVALKETIDKMDIKLKKIQSASSATFETTTQVNTYLKDSTLLDTVPIKTFSRSTKFNDISITIWPTHQDSLELKIVTRDKMTQVVYKEKRGGRFWTSSWWQKRKLKQIINFENPDTRIEYPQYVLIKK